MQTAQIETLRQPAVAPRSNTRIPSKRRRRAKVSVGEMIERALLNEHRSIAMLRLAAEKTYGPVSSLLRRLAKEEEYQLEYFTDWQSHLPEIEHLSPEQLEADVERVRLAMEIQVAQLPPDDKAVLDFVISQETAQRDFYLAQRQLARGKKLRAILLDLADEENIHINQLRQAAGYPPQPRIEIED